MNQPESPHTLGVRRETYGLILRALKNLRSLKGKGVKWPARHITNHPRVLKWRVEVPPNGRLVFEWHDPDPALGDKSTGSFIIYFVGVEENYAVRQAYEMAKPIAIAGNQRGGAQPKGVRVGNDGTP